MVDAVSGGAAHGLAKQRWEVAVTIRRLERIKVNFQTLNEVGLSGVLAGFVSIPGILTVTNQAHSNGHVDLTIEANNCVPIARFSDRIRLAFLIALLEWKESRQFVFV